MQDQNSRSPNPRRKECNQGSAKANRFAIKDSISIRKTETEIKNLTSDMLKTIRQNESELRSEEKQLKYYIKFIGESNASRTLNQVLLESEQKVDALRSELESLRQAQDKVFWVPSTEWFEDRLSKFKELLVLNLGESPPALRELLGPIELEAQYPEEGKPYYVSYLSINALALTEPLPSEKNWTTVRIHSTGGRTWD